MHCWVFAFPQLQNYSRDEFSNEPQEKKSRKGDEEELESCDVSTTFPVDTAQAEKQEVAVASSQTQVEDASTAKPQQTSRPPEVLAGGETTSKQAAPNQKQLQPTKEKPSQPAKPKKEPCVWRDTNYKVYTLKGHNDIILDVDCSDGYVLSAR